MEAGVGQSDGVLGTWRALKPILATMAPGIPYFVHRSFEKIRTAQTGPLIENISSRKETLCEIPITLASTNIKAPPLDPVRETTFRYSNLSRSRLLRSPISTTPSPIQSKTPPPVRLHRIDSGLRSWHTYTPCVPC